MDYFPSCDPDHDDPEQKHSSLSEIDDSEPQRALAVGLQMVEEVKNIVLTLPIGNEHRKSVWCKEIDG